VTICPECDDEYERVASHWARSACGYPEISAEQRAVLDGLVLGGANVDLGGGSNCRLLASTVSSELAEWTAEQLGWLHHGTRTDHSDAAEHQDLYRVRTPAHPAINRYERWGDGDSRVPPEDYELTPLAGRVWWAYAGGLEWHGKYDSQRTATISALDDDRAAWVQRVLATTGVDATRAGKRIQWHGEQLREWLTRIGDPVPGVEHKWATQVEYQALREDPATTSEYEAAIARNALQIANKRVSNELTKERFDDVVDLMSADRVAEVLGGGSFADARRVAGVDSEVADHAPAGAGPQAEGVSSDYPPDQVESDLKAWADEADELSYESYHEYSVGNDEVPSVSWFYKYYDGFRAALEEHLDQELPKVPGIVYWTRERTAVALGKWLATRGNDTYPSSTRYRDYESGNTDYPGLSRVYELFDSWDDALTYAVQESEDLSVALLEKLRRERMVESCPKCHGSSIVEREIKTPRYRCRTCEYEFLEPFEREPKW